ncbi:MAG: fibronectin type III domain-containing protein [Oscillospiraceae bacterium]|nr:fibronectin type III domain-containing protein [Oscillospiraceae bacterium]
MGWTCSFLGYIEAKLTKGGQICFKEGSIMVSAEFKFKHSQQTAIWAIPAYYYFELGAEVSADGKVYKLVPDRSCPVDWAATIGVEPKIALGGGAGIVDFASVGLRGEGSAPIKLECFNGHLTIDLKGALYAEGQILFIKGKKKIIDGTMNVLDRNLWGTKRAKQILSLRREAAAYEATASETVVTVMDRDYAQNTSSWLGSSSGVRRAPAKAAASGGIRFTNLQTSVYNQSQPQVVTVGDKQIMVYVADDSTRDDYNRLCLMYSVNENGTWSTPKAVYSDGNNDASPSLATDGEKVYVSWQKVAKKLTAADCESEQVMLRNMEIYLAEFNAETGSFENAKRLTNNSVYDYLPFTVVENEKASVYYAEGDPAGQTNKVVRYSGGSTATLKSSLPYVSALSAVSDAVSYSIDTDATNGLTNDMTVYTVKDGHVSAFEKYVSEEADTTENAYNLLTYGELDGKQTLFVSDGSSVYYQKDGKTQKAFSAVSSISGYLQAVKTDTGLTLLWLGYTDDSTEIFSCSYENGAWSEPVQVSSQGNIISFLSANYAGGTIRGVCNITENQFNESAGDYDIGQTNLTSFVIGDFTDLSVSAFAPDETELKPGAETVINGYVTQKGTQDISSLDITVTDTLGTNVNYQQDVELKSGSTINLEIPYTVPQDYKGTTITVRINTDNTDKDENDNTVALETGKNTILLNDRPIEEFDDVYILPLSVENYTALDIENLTLTYSIENYDENTENESVTLKLDSLTEDSYNDVRIAVKKDGLVYDEDGFARINIAVYDGEDELSSLVSVIENPDQECRHAETEEIAEVPATCLESGKSASVKCSVCGEIISGGEEVPALGHAVVFDKAVAATCTKTGLTEGKHCSRCKEVLVARKTVAKKAHTYKTTVTPATTSKDGKAVASCTVCKSVAKTVVIPKVSYFKLSASAYVCDGKAKTPTVTVKDSKGKTLKNGTDYTLAYSSGRKDIGRYVVKVTLKGYYSGSKILYFDIIPAQVSRPKAKQSTSAIALSWSKVAGSNIRYYVFSYNPGTKKYKTLGYTTGTSYTVKKLSSGTTYYYAVQAYNTTAKKWGKVSPVLTTATKPGTPTLKAVAGTRKATLSWNRQNGATGYLLYMATSKNGKYTKIATLKGNTKVSYTKTGLTKGRYYYFKVIAYKTVGSTNLYGAYSSVRYVKVK